MIKQGYTLIELLVVIAITMLLLGAGIANYIRFNDRQKIKQTQELIRQVVSQTQTSVRSGKLQGCTNLLAYKIRYSGSQISTTPLCDDVNEAPQASSYDLPTGIVFTSTTEVFVRPISGLIYSSLEWLAPNNPFIIEFAKDNLSASLQIDHSGAVKEYFAN